MPASQFQNITTKSGLLAADDVLPDLIAWRQAGVKAALVTLVAIDGATPRPLGAQMAVAEDGSYTGYLSGGCLEQTVALEAVAALRDGKNRLVRFGKGSPYFDIQLPCGSGLDIYFDQALSDDVLAAAQTFQTDRTGFIMTTDLATAQSSVERLPSDAHPTSLRIGDTFTRTHTPKPRVLIVGGGPMLVAIAMLVSTAGFDIEIASPDGDARAAVEATGLKTRGLTSADELRPDLALDRWSATIVAFHEHDWEAPVLAQILKTPSFYIGVLGGRKAQMDRMQKLEAMGFGASELARVRGPVGMIPGAKSRISLAAGILAELVAEAKAAGLVA